MPAIHQLLFSQQNIVPDPPAYSDHNTCIGSRIISRASRNRASARKALREWIVAAIGSKIQAFVELGQKFFRKRYFILNYFICKITTAISEGINNKIKRLKRMAYGYKDVTYFLLKIHQHCGLLNPRFQLKYE